MTSTTLNKYLSADLSFFHEMNRRMPTKQPEKYISKYIDGHRILPPGSPYPGIYRINRTPYIIEIIDNFGPYSEIRHVAIKKGVQIAMTTAAENMIAFYMQERPGRVMYMSATDDLLEIFSSDRLDPLIDSIGMRDMISDQSEAFNSRKTGDKSKYKQYPGGVLILTSAQSAGKMRSSSIQFMIRDEIDGAPRQLRTGEGNFLSVSEGRLEAFGDRGKILDLSTPTLHGESLIDDQYDKGDQRLFMVECPNCEKFQFLSMGTEKSNYGLKGDYKGGELITGWYQCFHCHDAIFDHHKQGLLDSGHWEPSVKPIDRYFRSYHLPSFYSPPGFTSFTKMRKKYDIAMEKGDDELRSFTNLYLGKSFKPSGERPKLESVYELRSTYKSGTVPSGMLYLTLAGDVQSGRDIYKEHSNAEIDEEVTKFTAKRDYKKLEGLPRLEFEVMGHGVDFRTASIEYKIFYGRIDDHTAGAWEKLTEWIQDTELVFKRKDDFKFGVKMIFIDSGMGKYTDVVYNYCESLPNTYAIKGERELKKDKLKTATIDEMSRGNYTRFRLSNSGSYSFVLINTNYYKINIYKNLKNKTDPINGQPPNSHQTPSDYPDSYFKALTAEEMKKDGSFHNTAQRRNEALDLFCYNKCASDFWIEGLIMADRDQIKRKFSHYTKDKLIELVNRKTITERFLNELRRSGW